MTYYLYTYVGYKVFYVCNHTGPVHVLTYVTKLQKIIIATHNLLR